MRCVFLTSSPSFLTSGKILPSAFQHLFHRFNASFSQTRFFRGYRLYAVDGSDIHIPTNPDDHGTHYNSNADSTGYNLLHLNALYDLMNRRYMDAVLQDKRSENEHSALIDMAQNLKCNAIIVADRGYESYNTIAHLENNGLKYVIRIRTTSGIAQKLNISSDEETDFSMHCFNNSDLELRRIPPIRFPFWHKNAPFR